MIKKAIAIGFLVFMNSQAHASLVGQTITGSIDFTDFNTGNCFDPSNPNSASLCNANFTNTSGIQPNAIVSEDDDNYPLFANNSYPEFLYSDTGAGGDFLDVAVDVDSSSVLVEIIDRSNTLPEDALTPWGWTIDLSGLDGIIAAGIIAQSSSTPFAVNFSSGTLSIDFIGRNHGGSLESGIEAQWKADGYLFANIALQPVPIPAAAWLFLSALSGLGVIKRRRS